MEYYSATRKSEIIPFAATWMDLEIIILNEVTQRETDTIWHDLNMESKIWHRWTYIWKRNRLTDIENRLVVAKDLGRCGLKVGVSCAMCLVAQSCLTLWDPMDCSLPGLSVHGDSPGKNTGMDCHTLFQGIFPTQGLSPGLPHCRRILTD